MSYSDVVLILFLLKEKFYFYRMYLLLEGDAYFKVTEMSNSKHQNLVIFSFKMRMKHRFLLSINQI